MTSEAELGRSALESKERAELQTIAETLGVKTTSRMKKADMITEILSGAGVGESSSSGNGGGEPAPKPTSRRPRPTPAAKDDAESGADTPSSAGSSRGS